MGRFLLFTRPPDGQLRPFQLGLALDWEQSRLSHLLSRMIRRGFVTRQDCPGDRRGTVVVLTGPGRAAIESAAPGHVAAVRRLVFDQLNSAHAAAFGQAFEAILTALEQDGKQLSDPVIGDPVSGHDGPSAVVAAGQRLVWGLRNGPCHTLRPDRPSRLPGPRIRRDR